MMLASWTATPATTSTTASASVPEPTHVELFDENGNIEASLVIAADGTVDATTANAIEKLFECRRSHRERHIDRGLLAMIADLSTHYPGKTIEFISAYRGNREESKTSPHRAGRALDFRIPGVALTEIRDYLWTRYSEVGIGYYPERKFIHMDHRPGETDMSWTEINGNNHYHPAWADAARRGGKLKPDHRPGV